MTEQEMLPVMGMKAIPSPLLHVDGIEAFKVMRKDDGKSLEDDAREIIDQIMQDGFAVLVAAGRNASGKGEILRGFWRIIRNNKGLQRWRKKNDIDFQMHSIPFALCMAAAELETIPKEFSIPRGFNPATHPPDQFNKGSALQWHLFESLTKSRLGVSKKATIALIEVSTLGCLPINSEVPVTLTGEFNLGNSTFYNLSFDRLSASNSRFYIMDRGDDIREEKIKLASLKIREWVFSEPSTPFEGNAKVLVRNQQGQEVDLQSLPLNEQERIRRFLTKCMASPKGVERFDPAMDTTKMKLFKQGLIPDSTDQSYYNFIKDRIIYPKGYIPPDRFSIVRGEYLPGKITYDLTYFQDSLPATLYPELTD